MSLPKFFTINDRPVKVTDNPKGGWTTLALDMGTGDWVPADSYLDRYFRRDGDIDLLTEEEFNALVAEIQADIGKGWQS